MPRRALFFIASILAVFNVAPAHAQDAAFPTSMPRTLVECEGSGQCNGVWTFAGMRGKAQWPKLGTTADLIVEHFDAEQIVIKRIDVSNPGFTAEYVGVLNGDTINGTVKWTWPGHWNDKPKAGTWRATVDDSLIVPTVVARAEPPTARRFNINGEWKASTSSWLGGSVLPALHILQHGEQVQLSAADTTTGFETLRYDGHYAGGTLTGRLREAKDDPDAEVTGQPPKASWTNVSLNVDNPDVIRVPDGYLYRTSAPGPNDAVCDANDTSRTVPQYAYLRGRAAFNAHDDYPKAVCWFHVAALHGDARSQAILAFIYEQGFPGVRQDDAQALRWAKLSAAQGEYHGELALSTLYRTGRGTSADAERAAYWEAKAKRDYEHDPDVQSAMMAQQMRSLGGMLLGAMAAGVILGSF